jgi:hypothetical protein
MRDEPDAPVDIRIGAHEIGRERFEIGARTGDRLARLESRAHDQPLILAATQHGVTRHAFGSGRQRHPHVGHEHGCALISRGADTHDREVIAVQKNVLAHRVRASGEPRLPEGVAQHHFAERRADLFFRGAKERAGGRRQSEHIEVAGADFLAVDAVRAVRSAEAECLRLQLKRIDAVEDAAALLQIGKRGVGHRVKTRDLASFGRCRRAGPSPSDRASAR